MKEWETSSFGKCIWNNRFRQWLSKAIKTILQRQTVGLIMNHPGHGSPIDPPMHLIQWLDLTCSWYGTSWICPPGFCTQRLTLTPAKPLDLTPMVKKCGERGATSRRHRKTRRLSEWDTAHTTHPVFFNNWKVLKRKKKKGRGPRLKETWETRCDGQTCVGFTWVSIGISQPPKEKFEKIRGIWIRAESKWHQEIKCFLH